MKIGLYLQDYRDCNEQFFFEDLYNIKNINIDLLVFPETCYLPHDYKLNNIDIVMDSYTASNRALELSKYAGCAVIIGAMDLNGYIYNVYANYFAMASETLTSLYIKHTMTTTSPLGENNYREQIKSLFKPIILKSKKIGMTICYDCNHALFSRVYGKQNVDIIINSTGGNVVYDKWYRYNRVRALENHCFSFCTMGYEDKGKNHSYTFGFTPTGGHMTPQYLYENNSKWDSIGNIAIYDTESPDIATDLCYNLNQKESDNAKGTYLIDPDKFRNINIDGVYPYTENNIKHIIVKNDDIMLPEKILQVMYEKRDKQVKYIIVNVRDSLNMDYYNKVLEDVLRVRAMENYCAVLMVSPEMTKCFQSGDNRTSQYILKIDGKYRLDLKGMGGRKTICKNKDGMRASWRSGYEQLIDYLNT